MAKFFDPTYDPGRDAGTSGAEVTDLNPEQAYDTDLRRVAEDDRGATKSINSDQRRVAKFMRAAKSAGAYKQRASIDEPLVRGEVPRTRAEIAGVELPSTGDSGGRAGAVGYARKPANQFGKNF